MTPMTPAQHTHFHEHGWLHLRQSLGRKEIAPLKAHVLDELARLRIWSSGRIQSASMRALPAFQQVAKISAAIRIESLPDRIPGRDATAMVEALAPVRLRSAQHQVLVSLPRQGTWTLERLNWHTDITPSAGEPGCDGIQAFVLLDDVQPKGGATLAISGSHRLAGRQDENRRLRQHLRSGQDPTQVLGHSGLSIVEMSGQAGDVYLMDMRLLHSPSINASDRPRLMATTRFLPM